MSYVGGVLAVGSALFGFAVWVARWVSAGPESEIPVADIWCSMPDSASICVINNGPAAGAAANAIPEWAQLTVIDVDISAFVGRRRRPTECRFGSNDPSMPVWDLCRQPFCGGEGLTDTANRAPPDPEASGISE